MAYKNIVFVKLQKRLLNDPRWWSMCESAQLLYIKLLLSAAETYNRIPKDIKKVKKLTRCERKPVIIAACIAEIKLSFPKFKEGETYYFFGDFDKYTNYYTDEEARKEPVSSVSPAIPQRFPSVSPAIAKQATDKEEEEEKEKEKEQKKIPPSLVEVKDYCLERKNKIKPEAFMNFYDSKNWMIGKNKMKDWRAAVRTWEGRPQGDSRPAPTIATVPGVQESDDYIRKLKDG